MSNLNGKRIKINCKISVLLFLGYFSWRNTVQGAWFVQALCEVFGNHWTTLDLLTLLTRVSKKVAYDFESHAPAYSSMNRKKQMPCIMSMLTKDFYFTPKP
jgi:hypothetical protein